MGSPRPTARHWSTTSTPSTACWTSTREVLEGKVVGAQLFAGGDGGLGTVRLLAGQAVWNMVHLTVPKLADYRERIALYFDDAMLELVFPRSNT